MSFEQEPPGKKKQGEKRCRGDGGEIERKLSKVNTKVVSTG
jgi:hypothetical protein